MKRRSPDQATRANARAHGHGSPPARRPLRAAAMAKGKARQTAIAPKGLPSLQGPKAKKTKEDSWVRQQFTPHPENPKKSTCNHCDATMGLNVTRRKHHLLNAMVCLFLANEVAKPADERVKDPDVRAAVGIMAAAQAGPSAPTSNKRSAPKQPEEQPSGSSMRSFVDYLPISQVRQLLLC